MLLQPDSLKTRFRGYLPVVVDVETAGFQAKTDALLEIAAVTVDFNSKGFLVPQQSYHAHVEPFAGANIEQSAIDFNGIDPFSDLRGAIPEEQALREMFQFIRQAQRAAACKRVVLVGHNATFDHSFVMAAAERCQLKRNPFHPFVTFDTSTLAAVALGQTVLYKACTTANIAFDQQQAHSALYDTQKTTELFCWIVNRWKEFGAWPLED